MPAVLQKKGGNLFFFVTYTFASKKLILMIILFSLYNIINLYNGKEHFWRN